MTYDPNRHHRRSIRLRGYDYTQAGTYFVTLCAYDRACLFGEIVAECWRAIPDHFGHVTLDAFVIMPNHVHGVLVMDDDWAANTRARHAAPLPTRPHPGESKQAEQFGTPRSGSVPTIVRSFKSATTKRINERRGAPGAPVLQRNYYELVIRNEASLRGIRDYIAANPARWADDPENPAKLTPVGRPIP